MSILTVSYASDIPPEKHLQAALLLILIFGGMFLGVRALGRRLWGARRAMLKAYAAERGWQYQPGNSDWARVFSATPFNIGINRKARDVLSGHVDDLPFVSFEYLCIDKGSSGVGNSVASTRFFSVVAIPLSWALPRTEFDTEWVGDKVVKAFGGEDLDVESSAFNKLWRIRTLDKKAAHSLLTPRMIALLLTPEFEGRSFFFERGFLVHYIEAPRNEHNTDFMLAPWQALIDAVPDFIFEDFKREG